MLSRSMPVAPQAQPSDELGLPRLAAALVVLGIPTLLFNRAVLPALPGSRTGIERLFDHLTYAGGLLSQLLALGLSLLIIKLIAASLGAFALGIAGRLMALPVGSAVGFLLIASTIAPLDADMHLLLAGFGTLALLSGLRPTLQQPSVRAAGLFLLLTFLASLANTGGRLLALRASIEALPRPYAIARGLATAGLALDIVSLAWLVAWLVLSAPKNSRNHDRYRTLAYLGISAALGICCALLGRLGRDSGANFVEIIIGRSISALGREPSPFGTTLLGPTIDVIALLFAGLLLTRPKHINCVIRWAVALLLLGRCSPDIPIHAACLTAGTLLLTWYSPSTMGRAHDNASPTPHEL